MRDDRTPHLSLPLPNGENTLDEDLPRLRAAFTALDAHGHELDVAIGQEAAARESGDLSNTQALADPIQLCTAGLAAHDADASAHDTLVGRITAMVATTESAGVVKPDGVTVTVDAAGTLSAAASLIPDGVSIVSDGNNVISAVMPEPVTPLYVENGELRIDVTAIDSGSSIANDVWFGLLTGVANESFTSSGNYTIQETGLYRLTAVGGGGGGGGGYSTSASCGGGGGAGGTVYKIFRFHAGDNINFVIGGGGAGGAKSTGGGGGGGGGGGETYVKLSETYIVRAGGGGGGGGGNLYNYGGGGGGGDGAGGSGSAGTADVGGKGGNGGGGVPGGLGGSNGSSGTRSFSGSSGFIISSAGVGGSNFLNNGRGKGGNGGNGAAGSSGTSGMVQIASLF
jgi:hypothetical protein